ncbi:MULTISPECIES: hypothetical protein [unclassified Paenibacillus]|uniref:SDH family Clp fold serine proteinase n=1 Tax=unclassified Paenibacillus TaxID=185978 RepID=UPI00240700FE|nr:MULTISPECIES: hypothetical protein [unclassified Paenibacillus]MDF9845473.1 hypothetical protein [Paenibacillus sp. PastF-2]MDF9852057.1 hypothetical protein [Paenibacillus sp. PastM-2]MDF9858632.1 hypothetical protein [Paenibacillus sp. PastF-1]MDH6483898.1 hypothetical protein [Paenibacillus sp. PastH-2]MDH6511267.1 hypothetical protein [Paenibacillus sp. PastM-3]
MYSSRCIDYINLEDSFNTRIITYVTGDRPGWETQISPDVVDTFIHHLDKMGPQQKLTLFLYTRGGNTMGAWSIVNLIRQFCEEFEIIVSSKAHSAGTLMCLGANSIIMTKQATLGPIDPSVNTPLNPQIPAGNPLAKYPVSVEAIKGYFELAKTELNINDEKSLTDVLVKLADMVHPLVLGEVYRAKAQIQMLAKKLLIHQDFTEEKLDEIISFLVSDSGSHDYTIYRREAREQLGLNIVKPTQHQYEAIKRLQNSITNDLKLNEPFDQQALLGPATNARYEIKRCLIESVEGGSHFFNSEGELSRVQVQTPNGLQNGINDLRIFEGWRFEDAPARTN